MHMLSVVNVVRCFTVVQTTYKWSAHSNRQKFENPAMTCCRPSEDVVEIYELSNIIFTFHNFFINH